MTQKTFDELWRWISARGSVVTVQERSELEHVFGLMRGCDCQSYLEIGTAEGNSLYVLGHAVKPLENGFKHIGCIDIGEKHTEKFRKEVVEQISGNKPIREFIGDSTNPKTYIRRDPYWSTEIKHWCTDTSNEIDCILIDGGHDFATVLSDSILYAPLATKYVFWHDIQLPEVRKAYEWFKKRYALGEYSEFISSTHFGYGICKIK